MPGEPFIDFGLSFRDRSPAQASFFAGYANGYFGYFPTIRAAVEGGYGAEGLVARTEVGAGEAMLDTALIRLYKLLGQLKPLAETAVGGWKVAAARFPLAGRHAVSGGPQRRTLPTLQLFGKGQGGVAAGPIFLWWFSGLAQKSLNGSDFLGKR